SEGNTRYYDNSQLRRLLNMVSLMEDGHKVSELSALSDEELIRRVQELYSQEERQGADEYYISQLIAAGMNYHEWHYEEIFAHGRLTLGIRAIYRKDL